MDFVDWVDGNCELADMIHVQAVCNAYNSDEALYDSVENDPLYMQLFDLLCCDNRYSEAERLLYSEGGLGVQGFFAKYFAALPESMQDAIIDEVDERLYNLYKAELSYREAC